MKYKFFFFFILIIFGFHFSKAQNVFKLQLYFESNSYTLSPEHEKKIDSLIAQLTNLPEAYQLDIVGHSDSLGNNSFNEDLSNKRAIETKKFFINKGFREEAFNTEGRGFTDPVTDNQTEEKQARNRRVTVTLRLDPPPILDIGGIQLDEKKFQFDADSGGVFYHESGSSVEVPGRIFIDSKGNSISGKIDFSYTEFRDPIDFILADLPMNHKENNEQFYFNSSGMFRLLASQNGKPVHMRPNSRIRVDFAINKGSSKAGVYKYSSSKGAWERESGYDPYYEDIDYSHWRMYCGGWSPGEPPPCSMAPCQRLYLMQRVGGQYAGRTSIREAWRAQDSNKVMELYESIASCQTILYGIQKQIDSVKALIKKEIHSYKIVETKRRRKKTTFFITCQGTRKTNEMLPLTNLAWKYKRKEDTMAFRLIKGSKWSDCTISKNEELYTIELSNEFNNITLRNVKVKIGDKISNEDEQNYLNAKMAEYDSKRLPYQNRINELREELNDFSSKHYAQENICIEKRSLFDGYRTIYNELRGHSIYCFFMHNYYYMTPEEKQLQFTQWLNYFDQHGAEMLARYQKIHDSRELRTCRDQEDEYIHPDPPSRPIVKIEIRSLGTYNVAELVQIPDTIEVRAEFRDEKKQLLWPVLVYLTDKTFNGVIRYDGSNRHGPYKFKVSPETIKALIAFDIKGQAWLCSNKNLPPMLGLKKNVRLSFILKMIKKPTSREELLKEL